MEYQLTPRQIQILGLATLSNCEVAHILDISIQTVKNHWCNIYQQLGLIQENNSVRIKAIILALEQGIIQDVWDLPLGHVISVLYDY